MQTFKIFKALTKLPVTISPSGSNEDIRNAVDDIFDDSNLSLLQDQMSLSIVNNRYAGRPEEPQELDSFVDSELEDRPDDELPASNLTLSLLLARSFQFSRNHVEQNFLKYFVGFVVNA